MADDSRLVTVRSADHHHTLVTGLWSFYQDQRGVDLFLQSSGPVVPAHKLICDVFLPGIIADQANQHPDTSLSSLLKFLYTGQVTVSHQQLSDLHAIALDFDFGMLVDAIQSARTADQTPLVGAGQRRSSRRIPTSPLADDDKHDEPIVNKTTPSTPPPDDDAISDAASVSSPAVEESTVLKRRPGRPRKNRTVVLERPPARKGVGRPRKIKSPPVVKIEEEEDWGHLTREKRLMDFQNRNAGVFQALDGDMATRSRTRSAGRRTDAANRPKSTRKPVHQETTRKPVVQTTKPQHSRRKQWRLPTDVESSPHEPTKPPDTPKEKVFKCGHCNFTGTVMERVAEHIRTEHVRGKTAAVEGSSTVDPPVSDPTTTAAKGESVAEPKGEEVVAEDGSDHEQKSTKEEEDDLSPSLRCPDCDFATVNENDYRVHLASHDPSVAYFQCHTCRTPFADADSFRRHDETVHGDCSTAPPAVLRCPRCGYRPVSSAPGKLDKYVAHLTSAHQIDDRGQLGARLCKCPRCDFTCVNVDDMAQHDRTVHRNKICRCPRCEFTCVDTADMKVHVQEHREADPVRCSKCEHTAEGRAALKVHYRRAHPPMATRLCSVCGYRAKSDNRLRDHARKHSGEKPFICEVCGRGFGELGTLRRHVKEVHAQHKRSFPCDRCGQTYLRLTTLAIHQKQCGLPRSVGQTPSSRPSRRVKETQNPGRTKPKPTNCRLCPYVSHSLGAMVKHVNEEHPGERGFACDQCSYTCKDPTGLNRHQLRHTGSKPFKCRVCDRSFRDGATCKRHQRLHGSRRPLNCPICHKKFDWPDYLRTHIKTVHKITDPASIKPDPDPVVATDVPAYHAENEALLCATAVEPVDEQVVDCSEVVQVDGSGLNEEYVDYVPGQAIILHVIDYPEM